MSITKDEVSAMKVLGWKCGSKKLKVHHVWKPNGKLWGLTTSHHSHIQVNDGNDKPYFHIGMFNSDGKATVMLRPGKVTSSSYKYKDSTSYKPNPIETTGEDISMAFDFAMEMCAGDYGLLKNNCQKFARIMMTQLGAKHHRSVFHP
ncbi:MAG: hypothetical protein ABFS86_10745 [Planctomycetota bacterium]